MTFSYDPTLPNPPNDPGDDVTQMQVNSSSINQIIAIDHVGFNAVSGGGFHNKVTFNANNVPVVFPVAPPVLFTDTVAGLPQLKFFSGDAAHSSTQYVAAGTGSVLLLGGIIIKWGSYTIPGTFGNVNVTFTSPFPNNAFSLTITCSGFSATSDILANYINLTTAGFLGGRGITLATPANYTYIAIGN